MEHSGLGIIECRSKDSRPGSLLAFYGQLVEQRLEVPEAYSAAIVGSSDSMAPAFLQLASDPNVRCVAVAAHGWKNHIELADGKTVDSDLLVSMLKHKQGEIHGLHLSSCSTLTRDLADRRTAGSRSLKWVSGYQLDAGWVASLAADYCLLDVMLGLPKSRYRHDSLLKACAKLNGSISGLASELGLVVYSRNKAGDLEELLRGPGGAGEGRR
jgi:hypothetical protein